MDNSAWKPHVLFDPGNCFLLGRKNTKRQFIDFISENIFWEVFAVNKSNLYKEKFIHDEITEIRCKIIKINAIFSQE